MSRVLMSIAMVAVLIGLSAVSADASAVGTTAYDTIFNGIYNSGDTQPQAAGELTISYKKSATLQDSNYKGPAAVVSVSVDTGFDLSVIGTPANKSASFGDTISYAYGVTNLSNGTIRVYIDSSFHATGQSDSGPQSPSSTNWDISGSYKVYYDGNNNGLWANGDTQITSWELPSGANDTVILVVIVPTDANNGETTTSVVIISDRAPRKLSGTTSGDGWQDSTVKANDTRDTQTDTTITTVSGPQIYVSKAIAELSGTNSRPGDTLVVNITFDNDGDSEAYGVEIMDAVPSNTRFVKNSADSVALPTAWGNGGAAWDTAYRVYYDTDVENSFYDFKDTFTAFGSDGATTKLVSVIRWTLKQPVGTNNGGTLGVVDYDQTKTDNGRVEFRVVIQ